MQQNQLTLVLGDKRVSVDKKIADVSQYLHNLLNMGLDEEEIEIDPQIISSQILDEFIRFCKINDYKQPCIPPKIRTNNLAQVLDQANYNFIKEYSIEAQPIYKLLNAANFFVCPGLLKLIAAVFACKIYFQDTKAAFQAKKKELGIDKQITFEQDEYYKSNYSFDQNK